MLYDPVYVRHLKEAKSRIAVTRTGGEGHYCIMGKSFFWGLGGCSTHRAPLASMDENKPTKT